MPDSKDYAAMAGDLAAGFKELSRAAPEEMGALVKFFQAAGKDSALDRKTKELIATAISISDHCESCIAHHTEEAHRHGASREEMVDTIITAIHMGGGPAVAYGVQALRAFDQFAA